MNEYSVEPFRNRLADLDTQIIRSAPASRSDLRRLATYCSRLVDEMSKELVNCKRLHKLTPKFQELKKKFDDAVDHLDQMIFFATLIEE